jgi:hypothetical protein
MRDGYVQVGVVIAPPEPVPTENPAERRRNPFPSPLPRRPSPVLSRRPEPEPWQEPPSARWRS